MNQIFKLFLLLFLFTNMCVSGQTSDSIFIPQVVSPQKDHLPIKSITKWEIGTEAGANYTYYKNEDYYTYTSLPGPAGGLAIQRNFSPIFSMRFAVQYQNRTDVESFGSVKRTYVSDMICVPLTMRNFFGKKRIVFLEHGLRFDHWYRQRRMIEGSSGIEEKKSFQTNTNLILGLGTRIKLSERLDLSIRLNGAVEFNIGSIIYKKQNSGGPAFATSIFRTDVLIGINYKFGNAVTEKKMERDSVSELYATKKERKVFVKIFYSQQISSDARAADYERFEDSYYGNSHTSYHYDGNSEIPQSGQEFGVLLELKKRKHFNINIGLTYDQHRFQTKETTLFYHGWGDVIGNYSGSYKNTKIKYRFEFFTIPIIFNFVHKAKKCSFYAGAGIELKKLFHSNVSFSKKSYNYRFGQNKNGYKVDALNFFSIANIGMDVPISKGVSLFLEPNFKFELGKLYIPTNRSEVQLWSAGCKVGLKF